MLNNTLTDKLLIIAIVLVIIGALNWGWLGLTSRNLITSLNNATIKNRTLERIIYIIVGIAGLYVLFKIGTFLKKN